MKMSLRKKQQLIDRLLQKQFVHDVIPLSEIEKNFYYEYSFSKRLELKVNGSTPVDIKFDKDALSSILVDPLSPNKIKQEWMTDVVVLTHLKFTIRFIAAAPDYSKFGDGSALSNGIIIGYELYSGLRNELFSNNVIQDNGDIFSVFHHVDVPGKGGSNTNVISGLWKFPTGEILNLGKGDYFFVHVRDDLTVAAPTSGNYDNITDLNCRIQGYTYLKR